MSFKRIHENLSQRESMILIYRSLLPMTPVKIYLPPRHRNFILQIYAGLGLNPEAVDFKIESSFDRLPPGKLDLTMFANGGIAVIKIKVLGSDTLAEIKRHLKHLCLERFEVIHLHLDLCQASVSQLVPQCESLGFFFAGILPGLNNTHTLIMQYLNNVPLDYDKIRLHSPQAVKLLEYVKQADPNLA